MWKFERVRRPRGGVAVKFVIYGPVRSGGSHRPSSETETKPASKPRSFDKTLTAKSRS